LFLFLQGKTINILLLWEKATSELKKVSWQTAPMDTEEAEKKSSQETV